MSESTDGDTAGSAVANDEFSGVGCPIFTGPKPSDNNENLAKLTKRKLCK